MGKLDPYNVSQRRRRAHRSWGREANLGPLNGINAPEISQPFGPNAMEELARLAFEKELRMDSFGLDRYGRTIADLHTKELRSIGVVLLTSGHAWHCVKYAPTDDELRKAEVLARTKKRGLLVDPGRITPRDGRKDMR